MHSGHAYRLPVGDWRLRPRLVSQLSAESETFISLAMVQELQIY